MAAQNPSLARRGHPGRRRARLPAFNERLVFGLLGFVILIPIWEAVVQLEIVKRVTLSSPSLILGAAAEDLIIRPFEGNFRTSLWPHLAQSSQQFFLGLGLALVTGVWGSWTSALQGWISGFVTVV